MEFGVNGQFLFGTLPQQAWPPHLDAMKDARISVVRYDALWDKVEPTPPVNGAHAYNWAHLDSVVASLAQRGIRWLPIVDYSTPWAAKLQGNQFSPPASNEAFATYAKAVASRYGRGGSLWREHPDLPATPVTSFEIWNEPNHEAFWPPAPDPAAYLSLYLAARTAIRQVDPEAKVVFGGVTENRPRQFVRAAFARAPTPPPTSSDRLSPVRDAERRREAGPAPDRRDAPDLEGPRDGRRADRADRDRVDYGGPYGAVTDDRRAAYLRRLVERLARRAAGSRA